MNQPCRFLFCLVLLFISLPLASHAELPVEGRVLGPDGEGLAGIRVGLEPMTSRFEYFANLLDGKAGPGAEVEVVTDEDGYFELLAPTIGSHKIVVPWGEEGEITAQPPSYVPKEFSLYLLYDAHRLPPVVLTPAKALEIRVAGQDGTPADARLALFDRRRRDDGWRVRQRLARTGPDGLVRLPWDGDKSAWLEVFEPSHPKVILADHKFAVKNGSIDVRLPSDGLAGTVRAINSRGLGVAGAIVYQGYGVLPLGRTDEDGRFPLVVSPPEAEPNGIRVMNHDGFRGYSKPEFAPDQGHEITLTLEPQRVIRGRVIDLVSRQPVEGAVAWLPETLRVAVTDRDGFYEITQPEGFYMDVYSIAPGYALASDYPDSDEDADGPFVAGPTIALPPSATVRGRIVDSAGNLIPDVDIRIVAVEDLVPFDFAAFREGPRQAHSTRSGRFHISGLPPEMKLELRLRHKNFAPTDYIVEGLEAFEDRAQVQITMHSGVSGAGRIVDEDETLVAGAEVRLVPEMPENLKRELVEISNPDQKIADIVTHSDAQGQFRFSRLAPRRYSLEVQAPGFAPVTVPGLTIDIEPDFTDLGTVVLVRGAQIKGLVHDPDGVALAEVEVFFDGEKRRRKPEALTTSDADGHFVLPDLQDGKRYNLLVSKLGYGSEKISAEANIADATEEVTLEVVLRPSGTLSGYVYNEDGTPIARAFVRAGERSIFTDPQGAFRLENVGPGTVSLSAQLGGYQFYVQRSLEVPSRGEVSDLEIVLLRSAILTGTVSQADGSPAVGASVTCRPAGPSVTRVEDIDRTDDEGRFQLDDVAPGPVVIRARLDDYKVVSKNLMVRPGSQTVDLVFEEGFEISGRVATEGGRPVAGAALTLKTADGNDAGPSVEKPPSFTSAADGTFTLTGVSAGHYLLAAAKQDYIPAITPEPFEVGPGSPAGIYLELRRGATLSGRILGLELDDLSQVQVFATGITGNKQMIQGKVDHDGGYEVPGLSSGLWNVGAGVEDSGRMTMAQVMVEEGATGAQLDLEFKTGHTVRGVVKSGGEPLSGIAIQAMGMAAGGQTMSDMGVAVAETESDGRFRLNDLPEGKYILMVMSRTVQLREIKVPTEADIVIDLGAARIVGVVRDGDSGEPIREAEVRLEKVELPSDSVWERQRGIGTKSDSRGLFKLDAQPGAWRVIATRAGYSPAEATINVSADEDYENLELSLSPTEGISFEVTTPSGVLPSRVLTAVLDPASGRSISQGEVQLGEGAMVRLPTMPAGNWELLVQSSSSATMRLPISAPGHLGQIGLAQGGSLKIEIPELAEEKPNLTVEDLFTLEVLSWQPQARVRITGASGRPHSVVESHLTVTDQWPMRFGEAEISRLLPGVWKFTVEHPDGRSWSGKATVVAGETSRVVVGQE